MVKEGENIEDLLAAYLTDELEAKQVLWVEQWMTESEENMAFFENFISIWHQSKHEGIDFSADEAWNKIEVKLENKTSWKSWMSIAATLIILMTTYFTVQTFSTEEVVLYAEGQVLESSLDDGSIVTIDSSSTLTVLKGFGKKERRVALKGNAFFDIQRNPEVPFVIEMDQSEVKVLGTSFNIEAKPKDKLVEVYVKSGVVMFKYLSDSNNTYLSVKLKAGDKVVYNKNTKKLEAVTHNVDENAELYWMNQELVFDGIQLGRVAKIIESVYDIKIVFSKEEIKNCTLTVSFENASIDEIMEVIGLTFDLEISKDRNQYYLEGNGC